MSTKIYTGFKLTITDIRDIHAKMMEFRQKIAAIKEEKAAKFFADECVTRIDDRAVGIVESESSVYHETMDRFWNRVKEIKKTMQSDPAVDFSMSLVLFPVEDNMYGMVFTEQREFEKLWFEQDYVKYYGYWNNADPDEDCSEEEWNERERIWDGVIFKDTWTPALAGLTYEISFLDYENPDIDELLKYIPTYEDRLDRAAKQKVRNRYFGEREVTTDLAMKTLRECNKYMGTEEGIQEIKKAEIELANLLPVEITRSLLVEK
jgi:hypothetical protein